MKIGWGGPGLVHAHFWYFSSALAMRVGVAGRESDTTHEETLTLKM